MYSRDRLKKKATQSNSPEDWDNYRRLENKVNNEVKRAKRAFHRKEIQNKEGDCKGTWKVLNDLMNCKSKSTQIREIRHTPTELATIQKILLISLTYTLLQLVKSLLLK